MAIVSSLGRLARRPSHTTVRSVPHGGRPCRFWLVVVDRDLGRVAREVDAADDHPLDRQPGALAQVGQQRLVVGRGDQFDAFVGDLLAGLEVEAPLLLQHEEQRNDDAVGRQQRGDLTAGHQQRVHHRQRNDDEQVGHLADGNFVGAVAQHREDGEQAKADADAERGVGQHAQHEVDHGVEGQEGEDVVFVLRAWVVDEAHDDKRNQQIDAGAQDEVSEVRGHGWYLLSVFRPAAACP